MAKETLEQFAARVTEDGRVDREEVDQIRARIFADGHVDQEEASVLFDINDRVNGAADNHPSWQSLFVYGVAAYALDDDNKVDDAEAEFIASRISGDGNVDKNEVALLAELQRRATSIDAALKPVLAKAGL